jgi:hypothetical protein
MKAVICRTAYDKEHVRRSREGSQVRRYKSTCFTGTEVQIQPQDAPPMIKSMCAGAGKARRSESIPACILVYFRYEVLLLASRLKASYTRTLVA